MDIKTLELYRILEEAGGYVSQDEICETLNIRPRTLREYVKESRDVLFRFTGAEVNQKSNRGYRLEVPDPDRLHKYLTEESEKTARQEYISPITQKGRVDYIIRTYLSSRKYQRYEDIADRIFASRTTVYSDLKIVREKLKEYNLDLETKAGEGMRIRGSEKNIRSCISDYFFHDEYSDSPVFQDQPLGVFDSRYTSQISRIVDDVLKKYDYVLTDVGRENLNIHILIALFRIQSDEYMEPAEKPVIDKEKNSDVYRMTLEIRNHINKTFFIEMPETETDYMMIHLLGSRVFDADNDTSLIQPETMNIVRHILTDIVNIYGIDFFSDIDLFTMLCMHLQPMIQRIRNRIRLHNPILDDIREGNPMGYEMAVLACDILARKYDTDIDEQEIGYLALHFQLALERKKNTLKKKKILVVCASGAGTSRLLMFRLQTRFADVIEEIRPASLKDLDHIDTEAYDLIVSTVPVNRKLRVPVLQVKYSLLDDDVSRISDVLMETDEDIRQIRSFFHPSLFFAEQTFRRREEIIHFMCGKLAQAAAVPAQFEKSVLERERLAGTDLGLGIAMPHPMTLMMDKTYVVVCHLKKPVVWGKQKVRLVFLLASRKEGGEAYTLFNKAIYALINQEQSVRRLTDDPSFETLMEEILNICRTQKSIKKESIFQ